MSEVNAFGFKLGDKFEVIDAVRTGHEVDKQTYKTGSIVELANDDGSDCPEFRVISGSEWNDKQEFEDGLNFEYYDNLKKIG